MSETRKIRKRRVLFHRTAALGRLNSMQEKMSGTN